MKKQYSFLIFLCFVLLCSAGSTQSMAKELNIRNNVAGEFVINKENKNQIQLPKDIIVYIAGYCQPTKKNLLMKVCKSFYLAFQDKEAILLANPSTVTLSYKRKKAFKYACHGDVKKLAIWLSVIEESDINLRMGKNKWTLLNAASYYGPIEVVQLLIDKGADVMGTITNKDKSSLLFAAANGHTAIVQLLLDKGVGVNQQDEWKSTALIVVSENGRVGVVRILIKHDANINQLNYWKRTPLNIASVKGHIQVVRLLLHAGVDYADRNASLYEASQYGRAEVVALLFQATAVNNPFSYMPVEYSKKNDSLIVASRMGHVKVVQLLIDNGADVNYYHQETALIAVSKDNRNKYVDVVKLLLDRGAKVNITDDYGQTALFLASKQGNYKVVQLLINAGADVNQVNNEGENPLSIASKNRHAEVKNLLLDAGAKEESLCLVQ